VTEPVPVNEPLLCGNERKYVLECLDSGWISSEGPFVRRFEDAFAATVGRKHAVAVCNGTAAIDAAIAALDIQPGDEVILPTFTIISCIQQIIRAGAIPVLVDSDAHTWNMDVGQVARRISPRTRAIMAVHIYGLPVDMDPLLALARQHDVALIEDAAEMHGQTYRGRPCGSFGDLSTFSFYPNKHVTTGEGGMVVTDDARLAGRLRCLRNLCFQPGRRFVHEELGWNLRMTSLQAAVGIAQLERLTESVRRKREIGHMYNKLLAGTPGIVLPPSETEYAESIYWVYALLLDDAVPFDAEVMMSRLGEHGIGTRPFFWCMHEQPVLRRRGLFEGERYPIAERMARRGFYLPSGLALRDDQIQQVVNAVRSIILGSVR